MKHLTARQVALADKYATNTTATPADIARAIGADLSATIAHVNAVRLQRRRAG